MMLFSITRCCHHAVSHMLGRTLTLNIQCVPSGEADKDESSDDVLETMGDREEVGI